MSFAAEVKAPADEDISSEWVAEPRLSLDEKISFEEAERFVSSTVEKLDQKIFDPTFASDRRRAIPTKFRSVFRRDETTTRGRVLEFLNDEFKSLKISHLGILSPQKAALLLERLSPEQKGPSAPPSAVKAEMRGRIGVITVSSFLVPEITLAKIEAASSKVKKAKVILIDLRKNGGGSASSVVYLAERLMGPDQRVQTTRTRLGHGVEKPFIQSGGLDDGKNAGSDGDIALEREKKYVERRTRKDAKKDGRPHFLLVDGSCASSCEVFAGAVKESRSGTVMGTKTAGVVLGSTGFRLAWKGFVAIFPTAQVLSPEGNFYEAKGVTPDVELPLTGDDRGDLELALKHIESVVR